MDKLSLIGIINEESGEKGFAELVLRNLVKTGEKTLPKEIGRYEVNGVKMVLKTESYTYLMTKGVLTNEERLIIRQINRNIINKVGEDIFVVAIKEATRGLDRFGIKAVENRILNNYFDGESIARIENKLRPGMGGSSQLPAVIETRIESEINSLPEGGPILNIDLPILTNITREDSIKFLENKAKSEGIDANRDTIEKMYNLAMESLKQNSDFIKLNQEQTRLLYEKAFSESKNSSKIPSSNNPKSEPLSKNVTNRITQTIKDIIKRKYIKGDLSNRNLGLTSLQVVAILLDIYGTEAYKNKNYVQPITNMNFVETMLTKVVVTFLGGLKPLYYLNLALTTVDISSAVYDAIVYRKKEDNRTTFEKVKDGSKKIAGDTKKVFDSLRNEYKPKVDSLRNEYKPKADSLKTDLINKVREKTGKLDKGGNKEQVVDPFN